MTFKNFFWKTVKEVWFWALSTFCFVFWKKSSKKRSNHCHWHSCYDQYPKDTVKIKCAVLNASLYNTLFLTAYSKADAVLMENNLMAAETFIFWQLSGYKNSCFKWHRNRNYFLLPVSLFHNVLKCSLVTTRVGRSNFSIYCAGIVERTKSGRWCQRSKWRISIIASQSEGKKAHVF